MGQLKEKYNTALLCWDDLEACFQEQLELYETVPVRRTGAFTRAREKARVKSESQGLSLELVDIMLRCTPDTADPEWLNRQLNSIRNARLRETEE